MSTGWIKHKRKNWPEGSLERHLKLNYPGCKTLTEAFRQATKELIELRELKEQLNKNEPAAQPIKKEDDFDW